MPNPGESPFRNKLTFGMWFVTIGDSFGHEGIRAGNSCLMRGTSFDILMASPDPQRSFCLLNMTGEQAPSFIGEGPFSVIFDGVLYNRRELTDTLFDSSHPIPNNDATLVLKAYQTWDRDMLHHIKGIFALVVYNNKNKALLCARDPMGVYPLFYTSSDTGMMLSPSVKALVCHTSTDRELNRELIADHLCHRWPIKDETYYRKIMRVPPGNLLLRTGNGKCTVSRYWDPIPFGKPVSWVKEDEIGQFDDLFEQAVHRCLQLGNSPGIFLSGGIDSVSIAATAEKIHRSKGGSGLLAMSLIFNDPDCYEENIQKGVASALGLQQIILPFEEAVRNEGSFVSAMQTSGASALPMINYWWPAYHYLGLKGKEKGCDIILTGSGGDEWLAVSPLYAADLLKKFDLPGLYRLISCAVSSFPLRPFDLVMSRIWKFGIRAILADAVKRALISTAPELLTSLSNRRTLKQMPDWVAPDPDLRKELCRRSAEAFKDNALDSFYLREIRTGFDHPLVSMEMEEFFEAGSRLGMRIQFPFMDADLIEFLARVPPELLNRGDRSKGLVRDSLGRRFPHLGFDRQKKMNSANFFRSCIINEGMAVLKNEGGPVSLAEMGIVDRKCLDSAFENILLRKRMRNSYHVWDVLNLETWVRHHM